MELLITISKSFILGHAQCTDSTVSGMGFETANEFILPADTIERHIELSIEACILDRIGIHLNNKRTEDTVLKPFKGQLKLYKFDNFE